MVMVVVVGLAVRTRYPQVVYIGMSSYQVKQEWC